MISNQISYISLWSKDLQVNRNVFANLLGLPITYEDENVVVFQTEGTQLVLQRATDADAELDGSIQFGFEVKDLDAVTQSLENGGQVISVNREILELNQRITVLRLASGQKVEFIGK